jgi:hypothetical protein
MQASIYASNRILLALTLYIYVYMFVNAKALKLQLVCDIMWNSEVIKYKRKMYSCVKRGKEECKGVFIGER